MKMGDIYWVSFEPSYGKEYKKIRPGVVLQHESITIRSPYVTVMPITSQMDYWKLPDIFIEKDHKNNLFKDSIVKVRQISSFDKSRFHGYIGAVNSPVLRKIRGYLRRHFRL